MFKSLVIPAAAVAVLLSTPVFAQPAPHADYAPMQHRLQEAHDRLGITPAQQPQWDALVAALRENAQSVRGSPAAQAVRSGQLNAMQELHAASDLAHARADSLQRMIPPVEALYAALSPAQRQTFDRTVDRMVHRHGPHRG